MWRATAAASGHRSAMSLPWPDGHDAACPYRFQTARETDTRVSRPTISGGRAPRNGLRPLPFRPMLGPGKNMKRWLCIALVFCAAALQAARRWG